jgi:hypothetical protein
LYNFILSIYVISPGQRRDKIHAIQTKGYFNKERNPGPMDQVFNVGIKSQIPIPATNLFVID